MRTVVRTKNITLGYYLADLRKTFDCAISCVAYDERNDTLINSLRSTGIADFRDGWSKIYSGEARFASFSHQQWVGWVRENDKDDKWAGWLDYVTKRYDY